jgi:hypothetical protein
MSAQADNQTITLQVTRKLRLIELSVGIMPKNPPIMLGQMVLTKQ